MREFRMTVPAMQHAFAGLTDLKPQVTSVIDGPHVPGSAHFSGRAVDVGAIGNTDVGWNKPTWDFLARAITSRQFQRIGTIPELVQALAPIARQYGTEMFVDQGTGPHIHLQVGP